MKLFEKKLPKAYIHIDVETLGGSSLDESIKVLKRLSKIIILISNAHITFAFSHSGNKYFVNCDGYYKG